MVEHEVYSRPCSTFTSIINRNVVIAIATVGFNTKDYQAAKLTFMEYIPDLSVDTLQTLCYITGDNEEDVSIYIPFS